jgi:VanZ family protein
VKIQIKSFWPAIVALIVATFLFCIPGDEFPEANWLDKIYFDKLVHIALFLTLVFLWVLPLRERSNDGRTMERISLTITLAFVAYGIGIEFIQQNFIPHRSFDFFDIVADSAGCVLGWLAARKSRNESQRI